MTVKEIMDHLLAGKMVGIKGVGWIFLTRDGNCILADSECYAFDYDSEGLIGYIFNVDSELEIRDNE